MKNTVKSIVLIGKLMMEREIIYKKMQETFYRLYDQHKYEEAKTYGMKILKYDAANTRIRGRLSNCFAETGEMEAGAELKMKGISAEHLKRIHEKVSLIENFPALQGAVDSKIVHQYGGGHLCMVEHTNKNGKDYITKVLHAAEGEREVLFYQKILPAAGALQWYAPKIVSLLRDGDTNLIYITQEKAQGEMLKRQYTRRSLIKAIAAMHGMRETSESRLEQNIPEKSFREQGAEFLKSYFMSRLPLTLFDRVDKKYNNSLIFHLIFRYLHKHGYSEETVNNFKELETLIIKKESWRSFSRTKHFGLIHGNYQGENILINGDVSLKVVDWAHYRTAPKVIDAVHLLGSAGLTCPEIEEIYLEKREFSSFLSLPEKQMFLFALSVYWLDVLDRSTFESEQQERMIPLLEKMRLLTGMNEPELRKKGTAPHAGKP